MVLWFLKLLIQNELIEIWQMVPMAHGTSCHIKCTVKTLAPPPLLLLFSFIFPSLFYPKILEFHLSQTISYKNFFKNCSNSPSLFAHFFSSKILTSIVEVEGGKEKKLILHLNLTPIKACEHLSGILGIRSKIASILSIQVFKKWVERKWVKLLLSQTFLRRQTRLPLYQIQLFKA